MNICVFSGYLLEKPEVKASPSGKSVCEVRMNIPRDYRSANGERLSDYVSIVAWGRTAEIIAENCDKGTKLNIVTHVRTELYTDKNGIKRESHKYEVDRFEFAERKAVQTSQSVGSYTQPMSSAEMVIAEQNATINGTYVGVDDKGDEELPF